MKAVLNTDIPGLSAHSHADNCDTDRWAATKPDTRLLSVLWLFIPK